MKPVYVNELVVNDLRELYPHLTVAELVNRSLNNMLRIHTLALASLRNKFTKDDIESLMIAFDDFDFSTINITHKAVLIIKANSSNFGTIQTLSEAEATALLVLLENYQTSGEIAELTDVLTEVK